MHSLRQCIVRRLLSLLLSGVTIFTVAAQRPTGSLRIQVIDPVSALIANAVVIASDAAGSEKKAINKGDGSYVFEALAPGQYTVVVNAPGFAPSKTGNIEVIAGRAISLKLAVTIELEKQEVSINSDRTLSTDPDRNTSAVVLKGTDLDALPDDEEDLRRALELLAGPSAGTGGGQFLVDGFSRAAVPPKNTIREIRINQNPFSAEYDRLGFGRIEIFTKPGSAKLHGQGFFTFSDESLNSRNPYAATRSPFQMRAFGGNLSGPIITNKTSYFIDLDQRQMDENAVINATILDPGLNIVPFQQTVLTPQRRTNFSARLDHLLNKDHTLTARYAMSHFRLENAGVGEFNLLSKAFDRSTTDHTIQLSETAVLGPTAVNVARLQYARTKVNLDGDNTIPALTVLDAFSGGGAQVGQSFNESNRWELQDFVLLVKGAHAIKFGGRLRYISITDSSPSNFGGTYTFGGGLAPLLDANDQLVTDPATGNPLLTSITSIERYRRTLVFQQQHLDPQLIRALGGGATQFSISTGNPEASVSQYDYGLFVQDDWRARPNLTLSAGLRYETQNNISSHFNFAPRISFAWAVRPPQRGPATTVVRGGFGVFYDRVDEELTLRANRFNGVNQQNFIVQNPDFFPLIPPPDLLANGQEAETTRPLAPNLQAPYIMQFAIGIERKLTQNLTLTSTFIATRRLHGLRSRNINAPIPGSFSIADPSSGIRPFGDIGNIFQVESSSSLNQKQLIVSLNGELNSKISFFSNYTLNRLENDALDASVFPANSYDLTGEYGRSALDLHHRFAFGGTMKAPLGLTFNPFIAGFSSRPFNIIIGRDLNGDAVFAERPAFATDLTKPGVIVTSFGAFDPNPGPQQQIIPRNFGSAPAYFVINLRISRAFMFGEIPGAQPKANSAQAGQRATSSAEKRYTMTFSIQINNLLNHTNGATPIGNLSSPFFGRSLSINGGLGFGGGGSSSAANRRIDAQVRFSF